jgi:hypothetical protein
MLAQRIGTMEHLRKSVTQGCGHSTYTHFVHEIVYFQLFSRAKLYQILIKFIRRYSNNVYKTKSLYDESLGFASVYSLSKLLTHEQLKSSDIPS